MKNRNIQRILSCLLTLVMLFGMAPAALAADETQPTNYVTNGGFETWCQDAPLYLSPWQVAEGSTSEAVKGDGNNKNSGSNGLTFWASDTYSADVYQTTTELPAGTYSLSAYSGGTSGTTAVMYYKVGDGEEQTVPLALNGWGSEDPWPLIWTENTAEITITEAATVTVGFRVTNAANASVCIDDVTLTQNTTSGEDPDPEEPSTTGVVQNGSFEIPVEWNVTPLVPQNWTLDENTTSGSIGMQWKDNNAAHEGSYVVGVWAKTAFTGGISQEVAGLEPGTYMLSVWAQAGAVTPPAASYIYGYGTGQDKQQTAIDEGKNWAWAENKVTGIVVGEDGKATIGYRVEDTAGGYAVNLDDVTLTKEVAETEDTKIKNPSFESTTSLEGWTTTGAVSVAEDSTTPYGEKTLRASSDTDYTAGVSQEITDLEPGYYYLTAYAQSSGGQPRSVLYGHGTGQSRSMTAIPGTEMLNPLKGKWVMVVVRGICVGNDGKATIGFETVAEAGQWVNLDFFKLTREPAAVQSRPFELLKGGDTSCVSYEEDCGAKYYDAAGTEGDVYQLLADNGWDIVRLRLYNNPGKGRGDGSYYCLEGYETVEDLLVQAKRAKEKGLKIQFSFHYSDYWTNGGSQFIPAEWQKQIEGKTEAEAVTILEGLVGSYTKEVMQKLADQGTTPEYVSLGNEMQSGLLYPLGKASTDSWPNLARFLKAGYDAVKAVSPSTQVILHLDDASNYSKYQEFFDNCDKYEKELGQFYDVMGGSYYPYWTHTGVQDLVTFCSTMVERYGRDMILMETGFAFDDFLPNSTTNRGQLSHNIPYSGSGDGLNSTSEALQREFMMELFNGLKTVGLGTGHRVIGDLYWDPILVEQPGVGWAMVESTDMVDGNAVSNTTLFGFDHKLLPVMDAYRYNKEGSAAGELTGKVVNASGQGVAGVTFTLLGNSVTTDAYGTFRLSGVAAGSYTPSVDNMTSAPSSVTVTAGETASLTLTMTTASLSGTVTDAVGTALAGVTVTATSGSVTQTAVTGADGTYSFAAIPAGTYTVSAVLTGYGDVSQSVTVSGASTAELTMTLNSGVVTGTVQNKQGAPLAGVTVSTDEGSSASGRRLTAVTGADGTYTISGLKSGSAVLTFAGGGYARKELSCNVSTGETTDAGTVTLYKNEGVLKFQVVDTSGSPIPSAKAETMWAVAVGSADSSGVIELKNADKTPLGTGTFRVDIAALGYTGRTVEFEVKSIDEGETDGGKIVLPTPVALVNPSFSQKDGWTFGGTDSDAVIFQDRSPSSLGGGAYDDAWGLTFWKAAAFQSDASQTVSGLKAGDYIFRAHVYPGFTHDFYETTLYMYVKDADGKLLGKTDVPNQSDYAGFEVPFTLAADGSCTIGFYAEGKGGDWAVFDAAELGSLAKVDPSTPTPPSKPVTNPGGSTTTTKTDSDGTRTETTKYTDGSQTVVTVKPDGTETIHVELSEKAVEASVQSSLPLTLPMPEVAVAGNMEDAAAVTISLPKDVSVKVELPVEKPTAGTVAVLVHPDGTEEVVRTSVPTADGIVMNLTGDTTVKVIDNSKPFEDVSDSHWARDSVAFVTSRELFRGTGDSTFAPQATMTRSMLATVLFRLDGEKAGQAKHDFNDVPGNTWYSDAVAWAADTGVVQGTGNGGFAPDQTISREALCTMIYRYAKLIGVEGQPGSANEFKDADSVAGWASEAVQWCIGSGLVGGKGDGILDPKGTATRAEVAVILERLVTLIQK